MFEKSPIIDFCIGYESWVDFVVGQTHIKTDRHKIWVSLTICLKTQPYLIFTRPSHGIDVRMCLSVCLSVCRPPHIIQI